MSICVQIPLSKSRDPDISFILAATDEIGKYIDPEQAVVVDRTTYSRTTGEVIVAGLALSGLKVVRDLCVAFSPERIDPGSASFDSRNTGKIVGGITALSSEVPCLFYSQIIERVIPVSSTNCAGMVKLIENSFRSVNIGMVNDWR